VEYELPSGKRGACFEMGKEGGTKRKAGDSLSLEKKTELARYD